MPYSSITSLCDEDDDDDDGDDGGGDGDDDDNGGDDADDNVADTCSLGLLQRPGGQKIVADKTAAVTFTLLPQLSLHQLTNKQVKKQI